MCCRVSITSSTVLAGASGNALSLVILPGREIVYEASSCCLEHRDLLSPIRDPEPSSPRCAKKCSRYDTDSPPPHDRDHLTLGINFRVRTEPNKISSLTGEEPEQATALQLRDQCLPALLEVAEMSLRPVRR